MILLYWMFALIDGVQIDFAEESEPNIILLIELSPSLFYCHFGRLFNTFDLHIASRYKTLQQSG